jgi:hypothetical protein
MGIGGCFAGVNRPSSAKVKNAWLYISTSQYAFMARCLVKHRDNFTFTYLSSYYLWGKGEVVPMLN